MIAFDLTKSEYLNRRLRFSRFGRIAPITHITLSYQTAMEESRQLCLSLRFEGKFSEKSTKLLESQKDLMPDYLKKRWQITEGGRVVTPRRYTTLRVLNGRSTFSTLVEHLLHLKVD